MEKYEKSLFLKLFPHDFIISLGPIGSHILVTISLRNGSFPDGTKQLSISMLIYKTWDPTGTHLDKI